MLLLNKAILIIFLATLIFNINTGVFGESYNLENPMENFIPDLLNYIKKSIGKSEIITGKFIQDDIAILVYKILKDESSGLKFKILSHLILFDRIKNTEEGFESLVKKTTRDFIKGRIDNIKEIFWIDGEIPRSWSRKDMVLKEEKRCGCGCAEGKIAIRLCSHRFCFYKNNIKINR